MKVFGIQVGAKTIVELAIDEALALIDEKRFDEAIRVIHDKALAREPDDPRVLLHLGICHMLKGEYDAAEGLFRPLAAERRMTSEKAAAELALEKVGQLRREKKNA